MEDGGIDLSNQFAGIKTDDGGSVSQNYRSDGTISWPTTLFIALTPVFAIIGVVAHTLAFGISWIDLATLLAFYPVSYTHLTLPTKA